MGTTQGPFVIHNPKNPLMPPLPSWKRPRAAGTPENGKRRRGAHQSTDRRIELIPEAKQLLMPCLPTLVNLFDAVNLGWKLEGNCMTDPGYSRDKVELALADLLDIIPKDEILERLAYNLEHPPKFASLTGKVILVGQAFGLKNHRDGSYLYEIVAAGLSVKDSQARSHSATHRLRIAREGKSPHHGTFIAMLNDAKERWKARYPNGYLTTRAPKSTEVAPSETTTADTTQVS